jgi:hypothetical protein
MSYVGAELGPPSFPRPRPWLRPTLLTIGALVTAVALFWATTTVAAALARTTERFTRVSRGEITAVDISTAGSVDVRPGRPGLARSSVTLRFGLARPAFSQRIDDEGRLHIRARCRGFTVWCSVDLDLVVPADVPVRVSAGSARLADLTGAVTVDGSAGEVHLERLSGPLRLNLGAGEIEANDLTSADVRAGAGAGHVRLGFARPPREVEARAGAGEVEIELPRGPTTYRVEASAGAGDTHVAVRTDPDSERIIRADAGAGRASVVYGGP